MGKLLFRVNDQAGERPGSIYLDHPHGELRRYLVERIAANESIVDRRRIGVTLFIEVEFSKVAVDSVLVTALAVAFKVLGR
jgi:hypothetical protein